MFQEKFKANIDDLLYDLMKKQSKSIKYKDCIPYHNNDEECGKIRKIAFDMYRVENDPYDGLWMLEDIDGQQHLVRASDPKYDSAVNGSWSAVSDYDNHNITLAYKNIPIVNFSSDEYGYSSEDVRVFKTALLDKMEDDGFISDVFKQQSLAKVEALIKTFPELSKFVK